MRPARSIAVVTFTAVVAITGCTARSTIVHPAAAPTPASATPTAPHPATVPTPAPATAATGGATTPAAPTTLAGPHWPTSPRSTTPPSSPPADKPYLVAIRVGHHPTYDRVVFQFGALPGSKVSYVPQVRQDASDRPVPLQGHAFLRVVFHDASMFSVWDPPPVRRTYGGSCTLTPSLPAIRQVKCAGDFEGYLSFGIGVDHPAGFRVLTLQRPARVVIDVAT